MKKFLRIVSGPNSSSNFIAYEYFGEVYLNRNITLSDVSWTSNQEGAEQLIAELRARGWHPTDIADALDEARRWFGRGSRSSGSGLSS